MKYFIMKKYKIYVRLILTISFGLSEILNFTMKKGEMTD